MVKILLTKKMCTTNPTCSPEEEKEYFYSLDDLLIELKGETVIAGDLNGLVGNESQGLKCHGGHGFGNRNVEGRLSVRLKRKTCVSSIPNFAIQRIT